MTSTLSLDGESEQFEGVVVLTIDDHVARTLNTSADRADRREGGKRRFTEALLDEKVRVGDCRGLTA
jgi:hypothetical protein